MVLACRFHEIQPQTGLKMLPPGASSRKIVSAIPKSVPYPVLQENTLVLSNFLVVGKRNGKLSLMFRRAFLNQAACLLPVSGCSDSNAMCSRYAGLVQMPAFRASSAAVHNCMALDCSGAQRCTVLIVYYCTLLLCNCTDCSKPLAHLTLAACFACCLAQ